MQALETLRTGVADFGKDLRLNLQAVLDGASVLDLKQRWGVAVAVAATLRERELTRAVVADARLAEVALLSPHGIAHVEPER